jgi:HlyD family secretion protein
MPQHSTDEGDDKSEAQERNQTMSPRRKSRWLKRLLVLAVLAGGAGYGVWYYQQHYRLAAPQYQTSHITRGELAQRVTASGQLNPVMMVEVGSQISGIIKELLSDFNSTVKKGELVARIDPASYEAKSIQAEGELANAKAGLELAELEERRAWSMHSGNLIPQAQYDKAMADLHQAQAAVKIKEGALKDANVNLARCEIYTPIDGLVLSRNVNVGQTVAASLSAPTLFVIANDLTKMQIEANVAEADIGLVQTGQEAEFTVDAFPGQTFRGKVGQIRNAPKSEQSVVTYSTIIEVANPELKLKPGMTANVSIIVARRSDALLVPNSALRFRPAEGAEVKRASVAAASGEAPVKSGKSGHKKDKRKQVRVVYLLASQSGGPGDKQTNDCRTVLLQPVEIKTGINDASSTEVIEGLNEDDEIVTGLVSAKSQARQTSNPFASSKKRQ